MGTPLYFLICLRNRVSPEIEEAVIALAMEQPAWGKVRIANELAKQGISISPAGVRSVWQRHDLTTMKQRLKALETVTRVNAEQASKRRLHGPTRQPMRERLKRLGKRAMRAPSRRVGVVAMACTQGRTRATREAR